MFKNRSLAFRQCFFILLFVLVFCAVIFLFITDRFYDLVLRDVEKAAASMTEATANKLDQTFQVAARVASQNALMMESGGHSEKDIQSILKKTMESIGDHPEIYGVCIAFDEQAYNAKDKYMMYYAYRNRGKIKLEKVGSRDYHYFYYNWFSMPKILNRAIWVEPYYDKGAGDIVMTTYAVPFYRQVNGKKLFWGVATVDLSLAWLQKIVRKTRMYKQDYACLISKTGRFVTHPDVDLVMNQTIFGMAKQTDNKNLHKIGRSMVDGKTGFNAIDRNVYGEKSWVYYTPIESNEWALAMIFPENELFAELNRITWYVLGMALLGLAGLLLIVIGITFRVTRPLRQLTELTRDFGHGKFDVEIPDFDGNDEISTLGKAFKKTQKELIEHIAHLKATTAAKERIESELNIAKGIQEGILPRIFPPFPQFDEFDVSSSLEPAKAVGGDLYDYFLLDQEHLCFVIGDVSGKGIPASLFMAITQTLQRTIARLGKTPGEIVTRLSRALHQNNETYMFVTYFLGILNLKTGRLHFTNAGHNPPFMLKNDGSLVKIDTLHGPPIAISDHEYGCKTMELEPGTMFFMYTDGVTEAMDCDNNEFSETRLKDVLEKNIYIDSPGKTVSAVQGAVKEFTAGYEQSDDITMLALSYYGENKS